MADNEKKSIFDKAIDALTNRDEKAAAEAAAKQAQESAQKAAEAARQKVAAEEAALKAVADKTAAEKVKAEAEKRAAAAEAQMHAMEIEQARKENLAIQAEQARKAAEAAKPKFIAEYKLGPDDTLSHVALKFYGSATRDYWMLIYEANKAAIGDNPGIVRPGTVLQIPELPETLKKK